MVQPGQAAGLRSGIEEVKSEERRVKNEEFICFANHIQVSHVVHVWAESPKSYQKQHALKGQKLLAQGSALGIIAISKAPCKGKSFVNCPVF